MQGPISHQWQGGGFGATRWTLILKAAQGGSSGEGATALEELCRAYWYPVYAFVRRCGHDREDAEDLTQEFFARLLAKNFLGQVDRAKGRFRSFLLAAIKHFLANQWDHAQTLKRGGRRLLDSLEISAVESRRPLEPAHDLTPERMFERQWAFTLLDHVLARLGREFAEEGKAELFADLKGYLTDSAVPRTSAALAARLGVSEGSLKVTIHRLRRRYRQLLRTEIAQTVSSPREVDGEIRRLFAAFC